MPITDQTRVTPLASHTNSQTSITQNSQQAHRDQTWLRYAKLLGSCTLSHTSVPASVCALPPAWDASAHLSCLERALCIPHSSSVPTPPETMICPTPSQPSGPRGISGLFNDLYWMNIWKTGAVSAVIFPQTSIQSAWHTVGSQQKICCRKRGRKGQRNWIHWSQYFRYLFYELTNNYCLRYWKLRPSFRFFSRFFKDE